MFTCKIEAGFRVFIFIILHFVLTNCIREDMSGCPRDDGGLALIYSARSLPETLLPDP